MEGLSAEYFHLHERQFPNNKKSPPEQTEGFLRYVRK